MGKIEISIIRLLELNPGLSDKELASAIKGHNKSPQYINQSCRDLVTRGVLSRKKREDGIIGNWLIRPDYLRKTISQPKLFNDGIEISEKKIKQVLESYLTSRGWEPEIAWGSTHGIDIEAKQGSERWVIEVKGSGALEPMQVEGFLQVLGEILQRMDDTTSKYSVALPDTEAFRRLWNRLPKLAKNRLGFTALFVNPAGGVMEKVY